MIYKKSHRVKLLVPPHLKHAAEELNLHNGMVGTVVKLLPKWINDSDAVTILFDNGVMYTTCFPTEKGQSSILYNLSLNNFCVKVLPKIKLTK